MTKFIDELNLEVVNETDVVTAGDYRVELTQPYGHNEPVIEFSIAGNPVTIAPNGASTSAEDGEGNEVSVSLDKAGDTYHLTIEDEVGEIIDTFVLNELEYLFERDDASGNNDIELSC